MNDSSSSRGGEGYENASKENGNEADKELNRADSNVVKAKASENCYLNVYKRKNKETSSEQVQVEEQKVEERSDFGNGGEKDQKQNTTTEPNANETSDLGEQSESSSKKDQLGLELKAEGRNDLVQQPGCSNKVEKRKTAEVKAKDDGALGEQLGGSKKELKPRKTTESKGQGRSDSNKQPSGDKKEDKQKATETKTKAREGDKKKGTEVKDKAKGEDKEIFTEVKTRARTEEDKQRATGGKTKAKEEDKQKATEVKTKAKGEDKQKPTVVKTKTENKQKATEKKTKAEVEDKQKATTGKSKTVTEDDKKAPEVKTKAKAKSSDKKAHRNEVNNDDPMDSKDDCQKKRKEKEDKDNKEEDEKLEVDDLEGKMSTLELKVRSEGNEQRERVSKKIRDGNVKGEKLNEKKVKSENQGRKVQNQNEKKHILVESEDDGRKGSIQDGKKMQKVVDNGNDSEDEKEIGTSETALYKFPMNRVGKIIRNEDFNGRISQEAIFLINKALEKFLELLAEEAYASAFPDHKSYISYDHLSSVVAKRDRLEFLADFVPEKVNWEDVVKEMSRDDDDETT